MLPQNFGSGLRKPDDVVWGLWQPTTQEQQIYPQLQSALEKYGEKLDIVYDDPAHPASEKYANLIYPASGVPSNWLVIALIAAAVVAVLAVLLVARRGT